jgi:CIC family chloride channel protein
MVNSMEHQEMPSPDLVAGPESDSSAKARAPRSGVASKLIASIVEEEDRLPKRPLQWLFLMVVAAVVGVLAGAVGGAFRVSLGWASKARDYVVLFSHSHIPASIGWLVPTVLCAAGAALGVWLTQRFAPQGAGSGIPRIEAVIRSHLRPASILVLPIKFIGGVFSIGSGLALGREGPTVQMGGTLGRLTGDSLKRYIPQPWTLTAAGAGAGLAVAFNAPLAATLFVVEELLHRFSARVFSATLVACIAGTIVLRAMIGNTPEFGTPRLGALPAAILPEYLILGLLAGLLGVGFNISLMASMRVFDHAHSWPRGTKGAVVGGAAGLLAWFVPISVGGGQSLAQLAIAGHFTWSVVLGLLLVRFVLTMGSYGCGAPGGIFAPLLALGALLGCGCAIAREHLLHVGTDSAAFTIVAMAAVFTAIVRSPLTGVVLILEMTGDWTLILPMMAASVTAYAIPELLANPPIYDSLRERDEKLEQRELR